MLIRLLNVFAVILGAACHFVVMGQEIVSTTPQDKLAVLEEFGGMYCVYCPEGHQVIDDLTIAFGEDLVLLNYHEGYYASPLGTDPDLRSDYGQQILQQTGLSGFPAATVNRKNFPGYEQNAPGSTALGRANWPFAIAQVIQELSPVNIAAEATLNIATRELEVYIEYYYTSDAPGESNRLNAAILQNNVLAPQHGGAEGNYYAHQHLVRDFLTGQWGHIINNTNEGSFGSLTYNFTLPLDYRGVAVDPFNISLALFIGEGEQNIFTGINVTPELVSTFDNDVSLLTIFAEEDICQSDLNSSILIRNDGNQILETLDITYYLEGYPEQHFPWTGSLEPLQELIINLPPVSMPDNSGHFDLIATLVNPNNDNDPTYFNNDKSHYFCVAPVVDEANLELAIKTDDFGYELYWEIVNDLEQIVAFGGNSVVGETNGGAQIAIPSDPNAYGNNSIIVENIYLPEDGCYWLRVLDDYGDGLCCEYGTGFFKLKVPGATPFIEGGSFGAVDEHSFAIGEISVGVEENLSGNHITIFPNPVKIGESIQLLMADVTQYQWQLLDVSGRLLTSGDQDLLPQTVDLSRGYYLFRIQAADLQKTLPFIVQ